jgi:asparagine synthase (glutamine-hydrolysing)
MDETIYAVESFDYPTVRNCIPNYMATHKFLKRNRITLVGEGGDEIFAGSASLRRASNDAALREEREKLLASKFSTGFQRVDRMCASACLDGRLPMLQRGIIDLGLSLGRKDLIGPDPKHNKLVLRKAFEKLLPPEVVWRPKQKFSIKAGSMHMLQKYAEETISDKEFQKERKALPKGRIRTKEELMYFRRFQKFFHSQSCYDSVGRTEPL